MTRFFLQVRAPQGLMLDDGGIEIPRLGDLHENMRQVAAALVQRDPTAASWDFELHDEAGHKVLVEHLALFV